MSKLIVALGNPGIQYEYTRHNIAWLLMDQLQDRLGLIFKDKFKGEYAEKTESGEKIYFLKPHTYMNLSGESVVQLMQFFKIEIDRILVIHDEIDLPFGTLTFKKGGGLAGHNGLKSIKQHLGDDQFDRMRMGVGRPPHGSVSSWVLSAFSGDDEIALPHFLDQSCLAFDTYCKKGIEKASLEFNKKALV